MTASSNNKPTFVRWRMYSIVMLASFIAYTMRSIFSTASPVMIADLGLSEIQWGWVVAAFMTSYTLFQIPGGQLGDRYGPRRVLAIIAILWTVVTLVTAFVPGRDIASAGVVLGTLMFVNFLLGVVHAPVFPATNPVVINWFPVGGWALPNGLSATGLSIGVAASTPVLAWSIVEFGWRASFLFIAPLGLMLSALWWWYARDLPEQHQSVNREELELIREGSIIDPGADDKREVIGVLTLMRNSDVRWITLSYLCMQYTLFVVFSWFFYFLVEVRGFTMSNAGFVTSAQWIGGGIGAAFGGWYCDRLVRRFGLRLGLRAPLVAGLVASALCLIGGIYLSSPTLAIALLVACFFFNQSVEAPYWTMSMAIGGNHSGAVGGAMNTGGNAIGIFNALLVPWVAMSFGWSIAIASASMFSLLAAGMILLVQPERQIVQ